MAERTIAALLLCMLIGCGGANNGGEGPSTTSTDEFKALPGFLPLFWDEDGGRLFVELRALDQPFIYQSSLPRGIGSSAIRSSCVSCAEARECCSSKKTSPTAP